MPATPTSTMSLQATPVKVSVRSASRATLRSAVPAVTMATHPGLGGILPFRMAVHDTGS